MENTTPTHLEHIPGQFGQVPESYVFDHVPKLRELLPNTGGLPGVEYAQVCTNNARRAQDEGWGYVEGAKLYTIVNPDELNPRTNMPRQADMVLLCKGNPIPGIAPSSGASKMSLDNDLWWLTRLWIEGENLPDELQAVADQIAQNEQRVAQDAQVAHSPSAQQNALEEAKAELQEGAPDLTPHIPEPEPAPEPEEDGDEDGDKDEGGGDPDDLDLSNMVPS